MTQPDAPPELDLRLIEVFRTVMRDPALEIRPDTRRTDIKTWDSTAHIQLIVAVERQFGIRFSTSEIAKFSDVGQLAALISKKYHGEAGAKTL